MVRALIIGSALQRMSIGWLFHFFRMLLSKHLPPARGATQNTKHRRRNLPTVSKTFPSSDLVHLHWPHQLHPHQSHSCKLSYCHNAHESRWRYGLSHGRRKSKRVICSHQWLMIKDKYRVDYRIGKGRFGLVYTGTFSSWLHADSTRLTSQEPIFIPKKTLQSS